MRQGVPAQHLVLRVLKLRPLPVLLDPPADHDPRTGMQLLRKVGLSEPRDVHDPGLVTGGHARRAAPADGRRRCGHHLNDHAHLLAVNEVGHVAEVRVVEVPVGEVMEQVTEV